MTENGENEGPLRANPNYALGQIAKALTTAVTSEDQETRQRARKKVDKWMSVLGGMFQGTLRVGSRAPILDMPVWVTPEVVTGGFVTGELMAGGPLRAHEADLLRRLSIEKEENPRRLLNGYYLTEEGKAELSAMLGSQRYLISVPEEAALLVVEWLFLNGREAEGRSIIGEISPYFTNLRFYPAPRNRAPPNGSRVFLHDVGSTVASLRKAKPNLRFAAQKEAIELWAPLYAEAVGLFLETVDGDPPDLAGPRRLGADAGAHRATIVGGLPCSRFPDGWAARAADLLARYARAREGHKLCGKPDRANENFAQLRNYLQRCIDSPDPLSRAEVGRVRLILARYNAKRGTPNSPKWAAFREAQAAQVKDPPFHLVARVVGARLERHPQDGGIEDLTRVLQPVTRAEADESSVRVGTPIPPSIREKAKRCLAGSPETLVEHGIISSGETLAQVLPPVVGDLRSAGIPDPGLRQVYASVYQSFRRRRSLLLLNLEHQVRLEELPWVAPIEELRPRGGSGVELARMALKRMAILALTSFPFSPFPNKLIQEFQALAADGELDLFLTEELAADIFMGQFSTKFVRAAKRAAGLLRGTLYETYYGIDYDAVRRLPEPERPKRVGWEFRREPDPFAIFCASRAGVALGQWKPAINGMVIEQQQILTTHNLAGLFAAFGLSEELKERLPGLAEKCFVWTCRRAQMKTLPGHATLIMLKHAAYAWRQMVFFLALLPRDQVGRFLSWAEDHLRKQSPEFQERFRPALLGLKLAAEGRSLDDSHIAALGARRLLGWTVQRHWLLGEEPKGWLRRLFSP